MPNCAKIATKLHRHLCEHNWHGYTQGGGRWGDGEGTCKVPIDGKTYEIAQGDRDCSSSIIDCWKIAIQSTPYKGALDAATYTGNMRKVFVDSGLFEWKPISYIARPGDIYLNEANHTAMCQSQVPDILSEFCINEKGTITGGQVGDQTGNEAHIRGYYGFPWDGILHYNGKADTEAAGWQMSNGKWWYREEDGSFPFLRWKQIDGYWYRFDADGYAKTGWYQQEGFWYYLLPEQKDGAPSCSAATGWQMIDGNWYYFNPKRDGKYPECSMNAECKMIGNTKYHFSSDGKWIEE